MDELTKGVSKKLNRSCADQPEVDRRVGRGSSGASAAVAAATAALVSLEEPRSFSGTCSSTSAIAALPHHGSAPRHGQLILSDTAALLLLLTFDSQHIVLQNLPLYVVNIYCFRWKKTLNNLLLLGGELLQLHNR